MNTLLRRGRGVNKMKKYFAMTILSFLLLFPSFAFAADKAQISGDYCYQYGDSESLMVAKEISYAMALRKAIETFKTFISSTSIVKDFKLKKDLIEAIASGYVDDIRITKQDVKGRTVCTTIIGYVNPNAVKSVISRKVEKTRKVKKQAFKGLISNDSIKVLNYERKVASTGLHYINVLYQAKKKPKITSSRYTKIIINCFNKDGFPIEGSRYYISEDLSAGEVRETKIYINNNTVSFEIRLD